MIPTIFELLVLFQIKHFLADFPLQTKYMLGKFKPNFRDWAPPLAAHCGVHWVMTFAILFCFFNFKVAVLGASFDFITHFAMDRVKASPKMLGRFKALTAETYKTATKEQIRSNSLFWISLGFDQAFHNLVGYVIIYYCTI